jgi:hypothetical protein
LSEGFVEGSFGGGFVAAEQLEGAGVGGVLGEAGEQVSGGLGFGDGFEGGRGRRIFLVVALMMGELVFVFLAGVAVGSFDVFAGAAVGLVQESGLGLCVSAELVAQERDALEEHFFERGLGVEVFAKVLGEGGVGVMVGLGDEGLWGELRSEAVSLGVYGDAGLAFGRAGAGGFHGIESVGEELLGREGGDWGLGIFDGGLEILGGGLWR